MTNTDLKRLLNERLNDSIGCILQKSASLTDKITFCYYWECKFVDFYPYLITLIKYEQNIICLPFFLSWSSFSQAEILFWIDNDSITVVKNQCSTILRCAGLVLVLLHFCVFFFFVRSIYCHSQSDVSLASRLPRGSKYSSSGIYALLIVYLLWYWWHSAICFEYNCHMMLTS